MNFRFRAFSIQVLDVQLGEPRLPNVKTRRHSAYNLQILVIIMTCFFAIAETVAQYTGKEVPQPETLLQLYPQPDLSLLIQRREFGRTGSNSLQLTSRDYA